MQQIVSRPVLDGLYAFFVRTIGAAIKIAGCFDTVADNLASAMVAFRSKAVDSAFKAIEIMRDSIH
jgi:hypothetical protein